MSSSVAHLLNKFDLQHLFDALAEGVIIADLNGCLRFCNKTAQHLLENSACQDAVTQPNAPLVGLALALTPDGLPLIAEDLPLARALRGEIIQSMQLYPHGNHIHTPQPLLISAHPLFDNAQCCCGAIMTLIPTSIPQLTFSSAPPIDVSHLLVKAIEELDNGISIADARAPDMPIIYANPGFARLTGYTIENVIGKNCRFLHRNDEDQIGLGQLRTALRDGRKTEVILRNYRQDGSLFWNRLMVAPLHDEYGGISHFFGIQQDITTMINAQEALRNERDFIRMALESIPTLFIMIDEQANLLAFNNKVCEVSGYDTRDLYHMTLLDFFAGEERERALVAIAEGFEKRAPVSLELRLITQAGTRVPIYYTAVRRIHDGRPVLIGTGQDVSEYRSLLESLQLSEERLSRSHAFANIGLWDWNILVNEVYWSDRIPELLGSTESRLGFSFEDFFNAVHPLDRLHLRQCLDRCVEGQDVLDEEFRVQWPDGSLRWMLARGNVVHNIDGRPLRMFGVVQDITALKHAEFVEKRARQQIQSIIDSLWALICVVDEQGVILSLNRSWQQYAYRFGDGSHRLTIGGNYLQLCDNLSTQHHRTDMTTLAQGVRDVLAGQLRGFETEIRVPRADKEETHLVRITPLQGANENHPRVVINHQDITASRQIEADLRQAKEEAERASQAKSEFLSSMSHELRTPMNAVLGFAQLLEHDSDLNAEQIENVEEILRAGKHLLELINEILDLARIESGKIELSLEPILLSEIVTECVTLLAPLARQQSIQILANITSDIHLISDRIRLKQVIINLLSNAIKYNRPAGIVRIDTVPAGELNAMTRLQITDTGLGIPAVHIDDLFQPFARLRRDEYQEGTGIGLAVCRRLVEAMGGRIGVVSQVNEGSQFWIELPRANTMTAVTIDVDSTEYEAIETPPIKYRTILQIEDNSANLKLVERLLARYPGVRGLSAQTAALGIDIARNQQPDLILMDINMPGMDGYTALRILHTDAATQHIPVVALTANATARDIENGLAAGFAAYLTKPFNIKQLTDTLAHLLADIDLSTD
ncbi:PAS domain S-box protein [Thiospirillum jenense]|uniref:histidine kinase n=1 Tax=Thiospirillum jenense TaxID=1653858 RepID=A0A839HH58_9GAMM|nr:PAS domain S-box protein [Thiospirillum jenense]MBB1126367.1 PAS domain S-box protein [Thiospirillum jenense]